MHMSAPTSAPVALLGTISRAVFSPDLAARLILALDDEMGIQEISLSEEDSEGVWLLRTSQELTANDKLRAFEFCHGFLAGYVVRLQP